MSVKLTPAQRKRLDKLASYLEGLPKRYRHFDMARWVAGTGDYAAVLEYARHNGGVATCGTSACAAGHGPAAGILVPPRFFDDGYVDWDEYCSLFTGRARGFKTWLFAGDWDDYDNHHWGAAARIRYLLDKGDIPEGFEDAARKWRKAYAGYRIDAKAPANA